jgi:polysaccharide export outer membrane protein
MGAVAASVVLCMSLGGCASHANGSYAHYSKERDPRTQPYRIGPSDRLQVHVWRDEELTTEVFVRPDGTITLPLVGSLHAAGRTTDELKEEIKNRADRYVKNPVVTVAVTAVNSYRFTVVGNVETPGVFNSSQYVTLSEAVALAGGPNRYAETDDIVLIRRDKAKSKPRRIPVDYEGILDGDHPEQDLIILPGDTVFVP